MWTIYVQTQLAKKGNSQNLNQCQFTNQELKKIRHNKCNEHTKIVKKSGSPFELGAAWKIVAQTHHYLNYLMLKTGSY